jgi:hypothetical protein
VGRLKVPVAVKFVKDPVLGVVEPIVPGEAQSGEPPLTVAYSIPVPPLFFLNTCPLDAAAKASTISCSRADWVCTFVPGTRDRLDRAVEALARSERLLAAFRGV